jgi:AcrR family transcriptional regulator
MTAVATRRTQGLRNGGRSERVVRSIMRATLDELARVGYARLRVDDVAKRASVNKTSVYRRWPSKATLVDAAIRALGWGEAMPDTGSVRYDLSEMLRRAVAIVATSDGRAIVRLLNTEGADPEVERIMRAIKEELVARRIEIVVRAQGRGELPGDADARLVVDAVVAPVMTRVIRDGEAVDDETILRLVDMVLTGVAHGGGRRVA